CACGDYLVCLKTTFSKFEKGDWPLDRLEAMSVLLTVVKSGSFSAAARELGVPVANVSRKIVELERHLNTGIPIRSSRRMTVTDAGRSYVEAFNRILDEIEEPGATARREL